METVDIADVQLELHKSNFDNLTMNSGTLSPSASTHHHQVILRVLDQSLIKEHMLHSL